MKELAKLSGLLKTFDRYSDEYKSFESYSDRRSPLVGLMCVFI